MELQNFNPRQAQSRPQTWKSGVRNTVTGRPSKNHEPYRMQFHPTAGPVNTTNLAICSTKILSLAGPARTMSLAKWSSKISSAAGPVKTTNLPIWNTRILSLAGQAKLSLTKWSSCGRQPPQTLQNEVPKFHSAAGPVKPEKHGRLENSCRKRTENHGKIPDSHQKASEKKHITGRVT